jgi:CRP/FNR family transcriptional regulator, cyclic AMP receptor protein
MALNLIERAIFLRRTIIGHELPDPALRVIAEVVREEVYPAGTVIAREDDPGDEMLLVVSGTVEVRKLGARPPRGANADALGAVVARFGADDVLGEIAVLDDMPRSASIVAATDVVVLALQREDLRDAIALCPDLAFGLFRVLIGRIKSADAERIARGAFPPGAP